MSRSATQRSLAGAVSRPGTRPASMPNELTTTSAVSCQMNLEVCNEGGPRPSPANGGGHGLIGMRERAAMLGGSLDAGPTEDGGFQVSALLPVSHEDAP